MTAKTTHAALTALQYDGDALLWGGRKLSDIATDIGQTPFYVYDAGHMTERVAQLRAALPNELSVHFAMKANPHPDVVTHMATLVDGLDVASAGELSVAIDCGIPADIISFAGPGKRVWEIESAIKAGATLNAESPNEIDRIEQIGRIDGKQPRVAIRVNPDFELKSSGMKMGGYPSQFGIDAEKVPALLQKLSNIDVEFRGFHVYSGSQNLRAEAIVESVTKTVELVISLAQTCSMPVKSVNLGGGLGIPYFPNEKPLDLEAVGVGVQPAVHRLLDALDTPEVVMEMGRFLVGEAGLYVTEVIDVKDSRGVPYVICDGGLHHHLAASGNFGQVLRKNYPLALAQRRTTEKMRPTQVVGPLCTPLDLLGNQVMLPEIVVGDLIAVLQSGAYGATASPTQFLSQPGFRELLVG